jgi:hypothetical protein
MNYPYQTQTDLLTKGQMERFNFDQLELLAYSLDKPVARPVPVITIGGETISTSGNITTLAGQAKSGKSALVTASIAGGLAIQGDAGVDLLGLQIAPNRDKKAILHFDTEQSDYNHFRSFSNAYKRVNRSRDTDFFKSFNLRSIDFSNRRALVEDAMEVYAELFGGVYFWVLDGLADLGKSPNDETEAYELVDWAEKLCIKYACPLITVLHYNPGTNKARGHLGSQLERKSESVLQVVKIPDTSTSQMTATYTRNSDPIKIPAINFEYDDQKGFHVTTGVITQQHKVDAKERDKKAREDAKAEQQRKELTEEFTRIIKNCQPMNYTELKGVYSEMTGKAPATSERRIATAKSLGILTVDLLGKYAINPAIN